MSNQPSKNILAQSLLLGLIFSAGFFGYVMHTTDWFRAIPGDLFDARFNSVILEHLYQWVSGRAPTLWSPGFFYPFEHVLAFSDNHLGSGWSYILFRLSGLQREYAFIGWFIVGNLLNFWVAYFVFRRLGFSILAAGAGAFVYAFALPALFKEAHAQLTYRFAVPLSCLSLITWINTKQVKWVAQILFWLALQFYCSVYLGIFLLYLLTAILAASFLLNFKREKGRDDVLLQSGLEQTRVQTFKIVGLSLCSLLAIGWLLYQYQSISTYYGFTRDVSETLSMMPRPAAYLLADRSGLTNWIGQHIPKTIMRHEQQMFFGVGIGLIAFLGLFQRVATLTPPELNRIAGLALLILVLLTLSIRGYSVYRWLLYLPGLGSIRAVSRVVLVMLFPLAILVASGFDCVLNNQKIKSVRWVVLIIMILAITLETLYYQPYRFPVNAWLERQAEMRAALPPQVPKDSILYITNSSKDAYQDLAEVDGMILAQDLEIPTLNGYSGNVPPGYLKPDPCIDYKNRLQSYADFNHLYDDFVTDQARHVILITRQACSGAPTRMTQVKINAAIASGIRLRVSASPPDSGSKDLLKVTVAILNTTPKQFNTLSDKGPIRMSWRFVPIGSDGQPQSLPSWTARKELLFSLEPEATQLEHLVIKLPVQVGQYRLEVTLVQDGVAWFHDLGMQMAELPVMVK
jgi:hypothetical protein